MRYVYLTMILLSPLFIFSASAGQSDPNNPSAEPNSINDYFPREIVTGPKAWALACCALLIEYNQGWHDTLAIQPQNPSTIQSQKDGLKKWWEIKNRADLLENLKWLESGGHRANFEKLGRWLHTIPFSGYFKMLEETTDKERLYELQIAYEYYPRLGKKSIIGWDFARAIYLCRAGYECGYISENEAWSRIIRYARYLQQTFDSWEDLGKNYIIGRKFWSYGHTLKTGQEFDDSFIVLTETPSSPWNTLPWNMNLSSDPNIAADKNKFSADPNTRDKS